MSCALSGGKGPTVCKSTEIDEKKIKIDRRIACPE
jgi:hypothetical protein